MRPSPRSIGRLVIAMVAAVLLAGCTVLAADPTIRPGLDVGRDAPERDLQVAPPGPRVDAPPDQIVRDFIQALAGSGGDFVSAREFLTEEAADAWSPDARTVIFRRLVQVSPVDRKEQGDQEDGGQQDGDAEPTEGAATAEGGEAEVPAEVETGETEGPSDPPTGSEPPTPTSPPVDVEAGESPPRDDDPRPQPLPPLGDGDLVMRLSAAAWAEVDRDGRFRELPEEVSMTSDIVLTQQAGQWRIRHLEPDFGRWIATQDFDRVYDSYAVHYVYRADRLLIPDVRFIPTDRVATRLAQLQLGDVPEYLALAVRDDLPADARLAVGAVPIVGGVATVDLTGTGFGADPEARRRVWAQFVATLSQVRGVDRVQITLDGNPLEIPGLDSVRSLADLQFPSTSPSPPTAAPLVRQGVFMREFSGRPRTDDDTEVPTPPPAAGLPAIDERWHDLALSFTGGELAGVSGDSLSRWRNRFRYEVPSFATELGRPCYDSQDVLWVGGTGQLLRERLFYVNAAASPVDPLRSRATPVGSGWLTDRRVLACQISPQGTRIAIISDTGEDSPSRIDIGTILREANGLPTAVIGPQPVAEQFALVRDAVWLSETSLALLGQTRTNAELLAEMEDEQTEDSEPENEPGSEPDRSADEDTSAEPAQEPTQAPTQEPTREPEQDLAEETEQEREPEADEDAELLPDPLGGERGVLPYLVTVGGRTTNLPTILGGERITTTAGERNLVITTTDGTVYVRVGSRWLPAQNQGREIVVATR